ncbi:MAG: monovalent cation/H+ antiporter subunit D, partial [Azovibrio sp.]
IWSLILVTSLMAITGFMRTGSTLFWKSTGQPSGPGQSGNTGPITYVSVGLLLSGLFALTLFAGPVTRYLDTTAAQVFDTGNYIKAVLGPESDVEAGESE